MTWCGKIWPFFECCLLSRRRNLKKTNQKSDGENPETRCDAFRVCFWSLRPGAPKLFVANLLFPRPVDSVILQLCHQKRFRVRGLRHGGERLGRRRAGSSQHQCLPWAMTATFPTCKVSFSGFLPSLGWRVANTPQPGVTGGASIAFEARRYVCPTQLSCLSLGKRSPVLEVSSVCG